jgi:hypothetical protein
MKFQQFLTAVQESKKKNKHATQFTVQKFCAHLRSRSYKYPLLQYFNSAWQRISLQICCDILSKLKTTTCLWPKLCSLMKPLPTYPGMLTNWEKNLHAGTEGRRESKKLYAFHALT